MKDSDYLFDKAAEFTDQKQYLHAIQIYKSLLADPERKRLALTYLIEIYEIQNQLEEAVKLFESYFKEEGEDEDLNTFYAHFLIRHERFAEANTTLSHVSTETHPEKNYLLGMVNYYLSDYEVAQINFQDYIKKNQDSDLLPDAYLYLAKSHLRQYHLDSAIINSKASEKLYNRNSELYLTLAIAYYLKEMYFHANENIQKSIQLDPISADAYEWSGKILFKMGEFEKAEKQLLDFLKLADPESETYSLLGMSCLNCNKVSEAKKYFDLALELNPNNEVAKRGILDCNSI